jgi:hypothetical protein
LRNINRPDNYSTWHLSFKPEYAPPASVSIDQQQQLGRTKVSEKLPVGPGIYNCYMHGEALLSGEPMTADLQLLNSLQVCIKY